MNQRNDRSFMGGMGLARPVLNAMKVDNLQDFRYKAELYDELQTATEIYNRRNRRLRAKSDYNSDAEPKTMTETKPHFQRGLRKAVSFSTHISKRVKRVT